MMRKYQRYTQEFKLEAIRWMNEAEKPVAQLARDLGIRTNKDTHNEQTMVFMGVLDDRFRAIKIMESNIPLPTDNIFKFYAMFGVLLFVGRTNV